MNLRSNWKQIILIGLIFLHVAWIVNHLRLVYQDRINPWRLGGYGMYTVPAIRPQYVIWDVSNPNTPKRISKKDLTFREMNKTTRLTNIDRAFRCKHIPEEALKAFFVNNNDLINRNIFIDIIENKFEKKDPWMSIRLQGRVEIIWLSNTVFTYKSEFCLDEAKTGVVNLQ